MWTVQEFVFLTTYAIVLFLMASALFPAEVGRSDAEQATFARNRTWFFGLLLAAHLIDIPETAAKQSDGLRAVPPQYWFAGPAFIAIALTGLLTSRRRVHALPAPAWLTVIAYGVFRARYDCRPAITMRVAAVSAFHRFATLCSQVVISP